MMKWFAANKLVLKLDKKYIYLYIMKFITENSSHSTLHIGYKGKYIEDTVNTKYLGLQIVNNLNCKNHIELMIPKLTGAYYAVRLMVHIRNINNHKSIY